MSDAQCLKIFLQSPVTEEMIHHLVVQTLQVLPCDESANTKLPSLMSFITKLVRYTNVYTGTLMSTLVYLQRLRSKLPQDAKGLPCTRHRIFLACLILSAKYHNDSSPKNKHWTRYTDGLFSSQDVNLMERQLLTLLNWDLKIDTKELCYSVRRFLEPIRLDIQRSSKLRFRKERRETSLSSISSLASSASNASINSIPSVGSSYPSSLGRSNSSSSIETNSSLDTAELTSNYYQKPVMIPIPNAKMESSLHRTALKEQQELDTLMRQYCRGAAF
ncbi:BA75_05172T0 [Komagataella pastoris]|uniref:BA75_05172T0 n=1 Tax=Komagataella pastoris TaxID=4922 RepID=A0A1B2JIN8_PICPA|nr:BA75_05172T0 [Komagataella pastoris]